MAFRDLPNQEQAVQLLQLSLERRRLGHAYLFSGSHLDSLEAAARALAQTLNCTQPVLKDGAPVDACGNCAQCRKIADDAHPDVHWLRPESKLRIVTVDQVRELMREMQLRPGEAQYKVAVIVAADRMKTEGANAFLKTLEEPPPKSVLILLSTEPQRLLDTIISRCLRLTFGGAIARQLPADLQQWMTTFTKVAARPHKSLLSRYKLLDVLLKRLTGTKAEIERQLTERSPLERYADLEKSLRERWESELSAAIEAEYRRKRAELIGLVQWWLRDVWVESSLALQATPGASEDLLSFPHLAEATRKLASRLPEAQARENLDTMELLQRRLHTNVQEALALEVSLLKLQL